MKYLFYILLLSMSILCLVSCTPEDETESGPTDSAFSEGWDIDVSEFSGDGAKAMDEDTLQEDSHTLSDEHLDTEIPADADSISEDTAEGSIKPDRTAENRLLPEQNSQPSLQGNGISGTSRQDSPGSSSENILVPQKWLSKVHEQISRRASRKNRMPAGD